MAIRNVLLTFVEVRNASGDGNDIFDQAVVVAQRIAYVTLMDPDAVGHTLGRSLKDPVSAALRLRRIGVAFTADQKRMIAAFLDAGDLVGAQKVILLQLRLQFGDGLLG